MDDVDRRHGEEKKMNGRVATDNASPSDASIANGGKRPLAQNVDSKDSVAKKAYKATSQMGDNKGNSLVAQESLSESQAMKDNNDGFQAENLEASTERKPNNGVQDDPNDDRTSADYYTDAYSHFAIHEEMLKDEVRTKTYEMAIKQNPHLFEGKIVLDVGCGTGILSMFAAQAGARHVFAVDSSDIIESATEIIKLNNFENQITTIKGKIEEIELPVPTVDVLLSEWMGYCLLYESMLDSVLFARDKWLVPNGIVFPDKSVLYIAAIEDGQIRKERMDFWDDVYGFKMTPIKEIALKEPVVDVVGANALVTDSVPVLTLDILTCTKEDLAFKNPFQIKAHRNDFIHGLMTYFECAFTQVHKPIGFSTAPFARYTHWKQTIFYLPETLTICDGETIDGEFSCSPNKKNNRDLDIYLSLSFKGQYSQFESKGIKYRLR